MPDYVLDDAQCHALINRERVVRIAFEANGERYLIPLGYVWFEGTLCGMTDEGRKTQMASANSYIAFQLDNAAETGPFGWLSVTGDADFEVITDPGTIERLAPVVFERFSDGPSWALAELGEKSEQGKAVFYRIRPRSFSGRAFTQGPPS